MAGGCAYKDGAGGPEARRPPRSGGGSRRAGSAGRAVQGAVPAGGRADQGVHRLGRRLSGEPDAALRDGAPLPPLHTLPAAPEAEPGALCLLHKRIWGAGRGELPGAVPAHPGRARGNPADQGHPAPREDPGRGRPAPAGACRQRQGPGGAAHDRGLGAQRPRARLRVWIDPGRGAIPPGIPPDGAPPGGERVRPAAPRLRRVRLPPGGAPPSPAARSRAPRRSAPCS